MALPRKSSFASVGFLQNHLFCFSLSWANSILFIADLKNGIRTGQMIVFWPRKAKACVKSSVYFADRLMTSKRSRSLFFTAWKTSFRPPTTLQQKQKNLPYILLQLQISWSWKSKEIVNLCKEKSVSHVTRQRLDFRIFNKLLRDAKIKLQEHQTYKVASA